VKNADASLLTVLDDSVAVAATLDDLRTVKVV